MRSVRLKAGLLAALIACAAFAAAKAQEDKSYLPPKSFQGKAETSIPKTWAPRTVQTRPVRHASTRVRKRRTASVYHHRKRYRVAHHRGYYRQRYAYYRPVFPGFLFGFFNW